jgi:hypothetical protein
MGNPCKNTLNTNIRKRSLANKIWILQVVMGTVGAAFISSHLCGFVGRLG